MEKEALTQLIDQINEEHRAQFTEVKEPVAIIITLSDGSTVYYKIDKEGITEHTKEPDVENKIIAAYADLLKAKKSRIQLVRFLSTGRIKLRGNVKMLMSEIKSLLA